MKKKRNGLNGEIILQLYKRIPNDYIEFYGTLETSNKYASYLDYIAEIIYTYLYNQEDLAEIKRNMVRNMNKVKRRWYADCEKDIDSIMDEIGYVDSLERDTYKEDMINKVAKWVESDDPIFKYPLICRRTAKKKESFYEKDVILFLIKLVVTDYNSELNWVAPTITSELINNPIFSPTETIFDFVVDDDIKNEPIIVDEYYAPEDYLLRTSVKNEDNDLLVKITSLDQMDREIVALIYSKLQPGFFSDRSMVVDLVAMAKQFYAKPNQARVTEIENRIKKIGKYQCEIVPKEDEHGKQKRTYMMINFFESVVITNDMMNGKVTAQIVMGETLYKSFLKKATYRLLPGKEISNRLAKLLLPSLQSERLRLLVDDINYLEIPLQYFSSRVRFRYTRKDVTITKIMQSLNYLAQQELVIHTAEYDKESKLFKIQFLPLSDDERKVFMLDNGEY